MIFAAQLHAQCDHRTAENWARSFGILSLIQDVSRWNRDVDSCAGPCEVDNLFVVGGDSGAMLSPRSVIGSEDSTWLMPVIESAQIALQWAGPETATRLGRRLHNRADRGCLPKAVPPGLRDVYPGFAARRHFGDFVRRSDMRHAYGERAVHCLAHSACIRSVCRQTSAKIGLRGVDGDSAGFPRRSAH
jgi:hypothetical protein